MFIVKLVHLSRAPLAAIYITGHVDLNLIIVYNCNMLKNYKLSRNI